MKFQELSSNNSFLRALAGPTVLIAYSVSAHFQILGKIEIGPVLLLLVIMTWGCIRGLIYKHYSTAFRWGLLLLGSLFFVRIGDHNTLLYLLPILVNAMLLLIFVNSLRRDSTPLITRIGLILDGPQNDRSQHYTKRVTQAWVLFFTFMTMETALLSIFAPPSVWSFFANFANYVLIALFMASEYVIRIRYLPDQDHSGFISFLRRLGHVDIRKVTG